MALLHQFFSVDELKQLDSKELEILKAAIQHELLTSSQIRNLLRARAREVYSQLKAGPAPQGPSTPSRPSETPPRTGRRRPGKA
jgi:hypothetical protein